MEQVEYVNRTMIVAEEWWSKRAVVVRTVVVTCSLCGAYVPEESKTIHSRWHEKLHQPVAHRGMIG